MDWFQRDAVFTERLLRADFDTSFVWSLMSCVITGLGCVFSLVQMRLSDVKEIPWHWNNLTLELVG